MADRHFRHLSKDQIHEIVLLHHEGVTQTDIAGRYQIDRSTVSYHVNRYDDAYPEDRSVYAVIKAKQKKACLHPSSRCTLCGLMRDELYRTEWRTIERLTEELAVATRKLVRAGLAVE